MVDALVSGASVERRAGSSPVLGTIRSKVDTPPCRPYLFSAHRSKRVLRIYKGKLKSIIRMI